MIISLIAAIGVDGQLGKDNKLLWHIPSDLKHFKELTKGHSVVMGRKTFESIGRPLPNRKTLILSRGFKYQHPDVLIFNNVNELIRSADSYGENELFICGGAEIYSLFLNRANRIYMSHIEFMGECDVYFPKFKQENWKVVEEKSYPDEKPYPWTFKLYERI